MLFQNIKLGSVSYCGYLEDCCGNLALSKLGLNHSLTFFERIALHKLCTRLDKNTNLKKIDQVLR